MMGNEASVVYPEAVPVATWLRRWLSSLLALTAAAMAAPVFAQPPIAAPNAVVISPQLVTSGQPPAATLAMLRMQGIDAVIFFAPLGMPDAVTDEREIVEQQGLKFVPFRFGYPAESDFDAFAAALAALPGQRVLVHCQVNMRASMMVFLHRVIVGREPPDRAYEAVAKVWSPGGEWKRFMVSLLRKHGIDFDPY